MSSPSRKSANSISPPGKLVRIELVGVTDLESQRKRVISLLNDAAFELDCASGAISEMGSLFSAIKRIAETNSDLFRLASLGERVAGIAECDADEASEKFSGEARHA